MSYRCLLSTILAIAHTVSHRGLWRCFQQGFVKGSSVNEKSRTKLQIKRDFASSHPKRQVCLAVPFKNHFLYERFVPANRNQRINDLAGLNGLAFLNAPHRPYRGLAPFVSQSRATMPRNPGDGQSGRHRRSPWGGQPPCP